MEKAKRDSVYNYSVEEGFKLLDYLIESEFTFKLEFPYEGKDIKRITNFEDVILELTTGVTASLEPTFIKKMAEQGITEDCIYEYINRGCIVRTLAYMKDNNTGITMQSNDDEIVEE